LRNVGCQVAVVFNLADQVSPKDDDDVERFAITQYIKLPTHFSQSNLRYYDTTNRLTLSFGREKYHAISHSLIGGQKRW